MAVVQKKKVIVEKALDTSFVSAGPVTQEVVIGESVAPLKKTTRVAKKSSPKKKMPSTHIQLTEEQQDKKAKVTITDNTNIVEKRTIGPRTPLQLAQLSPFRFPLVQDKMVSTVARIAGVFFVMLGAIFSLLNLPYATGGYTGLSPLMQLAQLVGFKNQDASVIATTSLTVTSTAETARIATIQISSTPEKPLSGMVPVTVTVPQGVDAVILSILNTDTDTRALLKTSAPIHSDTTVWRFEWNTEQFEDGEYHVYAIINQNTSSYEYSDEAEYIIQNATNTSEVSDDSDEVREQISNDELVSLGRSSSTPSGETIVSESGEVTVSESDESSEADVAPESVHENKMDSSIELGAESTLQLSQTGVLSDFVQIGISTSEVESVEMFLIPQNSLTQYFLGTAQKTSSTQWTYMWDTQQTPNGEYFLYARVKTLYGMSDGTHEKVVVANAVVPSYSDSEIEILSAIQVAHAELVKVSDITSTSTGSSTETEEATVYVESIDSFLTTLDDARIEQTGVEDLLLGFRSTVDAKLNDYIVKQQPNGGEAITNIRDEITELRRNLLYSLPTDVEQKELVDAVDAYLTQVSFELIEQAIENKKSLSEKLGKDLYADADMDGLTNYAEVTQYATNAFSADSDGDGFSDAVELSGGYDLNNSSSEVLRGFESPQEKGEVRSDMLSVHSINTIAETGEDTSIAYPRALIRGTALPHSFVTLHVFSTPIITTVKTGSDGSWSYVFEKELEQGMHEVYITFMDNSGKLVAKSTPLTFTKTADAFIQGDESVSEVVTESVTDSQTNVNVFLLVASITVVSLGLVLLLLGLHVRSKIISNQEAVATL